MAIPFLTLMLLVMVQIGVVMVDQVAVSQAAREGARAAAVDSDPGAAAMAASRATGLDPARLSVVVGARPDGEGLVRVTVTYGSRVVFPLTGTVLVRPRLQAEAAMRVENPS